ncbi:MAG: Sir2 family NAD-dependent protein deacetylase, partial [Saezia sp.]
INQSGSTLTLVTQNVDDLHQRAGSKNVIPMHGELLKVRCVSSGQVYDWHQDVNDDDLCTCCSPARELRPHIVWFGEMPLQMDDIYAALEKASHFISIGTSGNVYPAAGFVQLANQVGAHTVELNLEPSMGGTLFKEKIYGSATQVVPAYIEQLLKQIRRYSQAI